MQRGFEFVNSGDNWIDCEDILANDPLFGQEDETTRSVPTQVLQDLDLTDPDRDWASPEPVYRSVDTMSRQAVHSFEPVKTRGVEYDPDPWAMLPKKAPVKPPQVQPLESRSTHGQSQDMSAGAPRKQTVNDQLVPKWPVTQNAVPTKHKHFEEIWEPLVGLMKTLGINDFKAQKDVGQLSGTFWGVNSATAFTINIYQKKTGDFMLDFLRRSGSCFDFHRVREEVLFALLKRPKSPRIRFSDIKDPETGRRMDEMDINEGDLNDWSMALSESSLELRRELTALLARASEQAACAQLMQRHPATVEQLYKSAFSGDTICTRYAMVALTHLLRTMPLCQQKHLDQILEVAESSSVKEIQKRCTDALEAVMNCTHPQTPPGLKKRSEEHLNRIRIKC